MTNIFEGSMSGEGVKVAIVVARFNDALTSRLLEGALNELCRLGVKSEDCDVAWVPGSFELPLVSKKMIDQGHYDVVIALGCLIRGETAHYELICNELTSGIAKSSLSSGIPIIFGVVTAESTQQAIDRCGGKMGHKGREAARSAIEMTSLLRTLGKSDFQKQWDRFREKMDIPQ